MNWLRDQMKTIIWMIVIAFVVTIFASWGMGGFSGPQEQHVATVDGEKIPLSDFQEQFSRQQETYREENEGPVDSETLQRLRGEAFEQEVNRVLLRRYLHGAGGAATKEEVREWLTSRPEFRDESGRFDPDIYQQFLDRVSPARQEELVESETERVENLRVTSWLENKVDFTDTEAEYLAADAVREVRLYGVFIDPLQYVADTRVQKYYRANSEEFKAPPRAYVRQIMLDSPDTSAPDYRQQLDEVNQLLDQIRRRHSIGDDFGELARTYSADTATASSGGLVGWVKPEELEEQVQRVVFGLQPGEISELVRREDGYYLYYLEKADFERQLPLEQVEDEIRSRLAGQEEQKLAEMEADTVYNQLTNVNRPISKLRNIASNYHGLAAENSGDYGWVPTELIVPELVENPERWRGELAENNRIVSKISDRLRQLKTGKISSPVNSKFGYHLLAISDRRPANVDELSGETMQTIVQRIRSKKIESYFDSWLNARREEAEIELNVPPEQVGRSSS
ncbi:MAG: peptidylprolyl isomerase [bacterium]